MSHSGTPASPITVTSYPGETAILDGSGASLGSTNGIVTMSGNYVTLANVELRNSSGRGVSVTGTGDVVSDNKFHDMKFNALIAAGTNEVIDGNEVWNTVMSNLNGAKGSSGWAEAMNTWQATNTTFRNNYIHDNWGEGIDFIQSNGGVASGNTVVDDFSVLIYVDGSKNIEISGNHLATTKSTFYRCSNPPPGVLMANESGRRRLEHHHHEQRHVAHRRDLVVERDPDQSRRFGQHDQLTPRDFVHFAASSSISTLMERAGLPEGSPRTCAITMVALCGVRIWSRRRGE